ncbi:MAG: hypothetical protein KDB00_18140 [Planctomycetales bacterium]|nr:hypothetical protein [Planctomycetales bacterium]
MPSKESMQLATSSDQVSSEAFEQSFNEAPFANAGDSPERYLVGQAYNHNPNASARDQV